MSRTISTRGRTVVAVAVIAVVALMAALPGPLGHRIRRLPNIHSGRGHLDTADPLWDAPVDSAAIRRAGKLLPDNARYYLYAPTSSAQLRDHDLLAAGSLYLLPAVQVKRRADADWVLSYKAPRVLPKGLTARRVYPLGESVYLVRLRRA